MYKLFRGLFPDSIHISLQFLVRRFLFFQNLKKSLGTLKCFGLKLELLLFFTPEIYCAVRLDLEKTLCNSATAIFSIVVVTLAIFIIHAMIITFIIF